LPAGVTLDAFRSHPEQFRGAAQVDTEKLFALLRDKVITPVSSTAALFFRGPYLTRLYSTMSAGEMTVDPVFNYNFELAQISHVHVARQIFQCSAAQTQASTPWRIELPQGGVVVGSGHGAWPVAPGSLPSNLKIVQLSTSGPGTVTVDNSVQIANALFGAATPVIDMIVPRPPQTGSAIGGTQRVVPPGPLASTRSERASAHARVSPLCCCCPSWRCCSHGVDVARAGSGAHGQLCCARASVSCSRRAAASHRAWRLWTAEPVFLAAILRSRMPRQARSSRLRPTLCRSSSCAIQRPARAVTRSTIASGRAACMPTRQWTPCSWP
jgi:hypothetical protein